MLTIKTLSPDQQGFTLLEILLVVVVIALGAFTVVSTLPVSASRVVEDNAQRIYQRLLVLNEDAILSGIHYGVRVEPEKNQLHWLRYTAQGWQPLKKTQFPAVLTLDADIQLSVELGSQAWQNKDRLLPTGSLWEDDALFEPSRFEDKAEAKPKPPQIWLFGSGEMTPFILKLSLAKPRLEQVASWQIQGQEDGRLSLTEVTDEG